MLKQNRLQFAIFFFLFLIGSWFLLDRMVPEFHNFAMFYTQWPHVLKLIGVVIFVLGVVIGSPDMFIAAFVSYTVGWIFAYQSTHGGIMVWAYMWTLIPGAVGLGMFISGLLNEENRQDVKYGLTTIAISAVLYIAFALFFGGLRLPV